MTEALDLAAIKARLAPYMAKPNVNTGWPGGVGDCWFCDGVHTESLDWQEALSRPMIVCPECGNKRCPKARWHVNACTGSNEPRQPCAYPEPWGDFPEFIALVAEIDRLTEANDRLARIASSAAVTLEQGKADLMAHGWDVGYDAGRTEAQRGHITRKNPYRKEPWDE